MAYESCQDALSELIDQDDVAFKTARPKTLELRETNKYRRPIRLAHSNEIPVYPIKYHVPVLTNLPEEADSIDYADFSFNLYHLRYLQQWHHSLVVGGSPHSGKSTFSISAEYCIKTADNRFGF